MEDKYIGLTLALISALLTGTSFIVTKKGLMASKGSGTYCHFGPLAAK